ncbi:MAG: hypothetical protein JWP11_1909 [Frankiales bacterium]|nr:hypothetical protein [Frankiales bacterium]
MPPIDCIKVLVNGMTVDELIAWHRARFGDARMEDPQKPDDVTQEEWDALGDPGRRALDRVRRARSEAERARDAAVADKAKADQAAADAQAELEKAKKEPPKKEDPPADVAAQIQTAVAAALENVTKTYTEQIDQLRAERAAEQLTAQAQRVAADVLVDPTLVGTFVDLRTVVNPQGQLDEQALRDNLATLVEQRTYLKRPEQAPAPGANPFGGHPGGARPAPDKATFDARVAEQLDMARQQGLSVRGDTAKTATTA